MTARTSWSVRAEEPLRRDTDPVPGANHRPLFADLLESRFDESGRLVRRSGETRSRVAERLGRDLPDIGADELEQAVAPLGRQPEAASQADKTRQAGSNSLATDRRAQDMAPVGTHGSTTERRQGAEQQPPAILDVLNRLEARLEALSERASRRPTADVESDRRQAPAPERAEMPSQFDRRAAPERPGRTPQQDRRAAPERAEAAPRQDRKSAPGRLAPERREQDDGIATRQAPAGGSDTGAIEEALDGLARRIEALDRNDRSLARAMEAVHGQLTELHEGVSGRQSGSQELALIAERLEELGDRLSGAELGPAALAAVERSFEHILERIGKLERVAERAAPPPEMSERLERLRRHVQALPGQEALSALEDRILDLAERIDAAVERGGGGRGIERLEAQLDEMAGSLAGLKQAEQARARDIETRLGELLRRIEVAPRGGHADMSAVESRLEELLARVDGPPAPQFTAAIASLEERLDRLGQAIDERPTIDLDPLTRQLKQLQGRLDQVSRAVTQGGGSTIDAEPLHRRLEEIQRRLEEAPHGASAGGELAERLGAIEERLAGLTHAAAPDLEPVLAQLASVAERLDGISPADSPDIAKMTALMERLEGLLQTLGDEDRLAPIGQTIAKISGALESMSDAPALEDIAELRTEIALLRREMKSLPGGEASASDELAPLLKDLARRLDRLPSEAPLTVADLESQIGRIVRMIEEPAQERLTLGPIEESLRRIEEQLESGSRAALPTALSNMPDMAEGETDSFTRLVSALSADLSALKEAATSSQHNMRQTLHSVHETLEGVARRIAALEIQEAAGSTRQPPATADNRRQGQSSAGEPRPRQAIPEIALGGVAAARPAAAPVRQERPSADAAPDTEPAAPGAQGLLGRLTSGQLLKRATGGRAESFSPAAEDVEDGPDLPLEPGTEEPMSSTLENAPSSDTARFSGADRRTNRVPGRAGAINRRSAEGGYVAADFLSAARRAAQAAAIEAAEAERAVETDDQVGALQRLFGVMRARRRMIVAGALAVAVAFAAWQYLALRSGGESQIAQAPAGETGAREAPARSADPVARRPAEPSRPDANLAFGEPLAMPGELQRRAERQSAQESGVDAPGRQQIAALPRDAWPPEAIGPEQLRRAAAEGDPAAQFEVAARYAEGRGVSQDMETAAEWYRRAADGGLAPAQYRLGSIHEKGIGVSKDAEAAMEWYRRAAEAGNAKAMHNLAVLYAEGIAGSSDLESAAQWFRRAAEHGVRDSQFNIGVLHARGLGVPHDLIEAYKWFAVA
ncbi:MAG TPA: hypothetical protein VHG92_09055, partial [Afifellaceae bacterium]|nr:hypothetical protein [Afifellaceae bacterium]